MISSSTLVGIYTRVYWNINSSVSNSHLFIIRFTPLLASSHIGLPPSIVSRRAVINVKNIDNRCFAYAIMSKILYEQHVQHPERPAKYTPEIWSQFNFEGIIYPTPFADVKIFERNNNASANIYGLDKDLKNKYYVYPLRIASKFVESNHFDLLYLQEDDAPDRVNGHYCLITNLARLVHSQITTNTGRVYICRRCLKHFGQQDLLDSHKRLCETRDPINAAMPSGDRPDQISTLKLYRNPFNQFWTIFRPNFRIEIGTKSTQFLRSISGRDVSKLKWKSGRSGLWSRS